MNMLHKKAPNPLRLECLKKSNSSLTADTIDSVPCKLAIINYFCPGAQFRKVPGWTISKFVVKMNNMFLIQTHENTFSSVQVIICDTLIKGFLNVFSRPLIRASKIPNNQITRQICFYHRHDKPFQIDKFTCTSIATLETL